MAADFLRRYRYDGAFLVFPLYLLVSGLSEIAQTVSPRRLVGVVLLWILPITGIRLRRAAETIQKLNADLDARVTASVAELRLTTSRLNEAQKLIGLGNWEHRLAANELWWSQQTYHLLGLDPGETTPSTEAFIRCLHPDDRERVRAAIAELHDSGKPYSINYRVRLPDGTIRHFRDEGGAEFDDDGNITRILGTIQDVSEQIELEHEVIAISERKRTQIGHDLHDTLAQDLTALTLLLKGVESRMLDANSSSKDDFEQLYAITGNAIATTRSLAVGLSPMLVGNIGLAAGLAENSRRVYRVDCRVSVAGNIQVGDGIHARQVYRITQEAIANAVRHGQASRIDILAAAADGQFSLEISDNGVGFRSPVSTETETETETEIEKGMGLRIMDYRARQIGGDLIVSRRDEGGTLVSFTCQWGAEVAE